MSSFKGEFFRPMDIAPGTGVGNRVTTDNHHRGDRNAAATQHAANTDNSQNCAIHAVIEEDVHYMDVFNTLPRVGKVKSCWVNRPDEEHPTTSSIKLVFFTHEAAQQLLDRASEWKIKGAGLYLVWDRNKVSPEDGTGISRVLRITGPSNFVNYESLTAYFDTKLRYQTQKVGIVYAGATGLSQIDWYFASYTNQAQVACMALERERPDMRGNSDGVRLEYRPDPCDLGNDI
ncbi:hypothetical protein F5X99DRAFT_412186 [Biscogniauxia marginata]|nr:hypothetical protein F5X99DRAFT_412186 [Biscogniauxia marginata]